ncbi:hypothetical protein [Nocardia arthritidis]|uniref:Uncharacterized protein n=1 Tax=Nocardia arthritidis TaxID=228602 RepID=A0A6G9YQM6_9NOCA|nr:hypothetical protein [Nocardia arthritidis]QIS15397.1 hypothetical protein F5544_37855 [Nocardia arthritidis]
MPLLTVRLPKTATLRDALQKLELSEGDVDVGYGLIPVDPEVGLFALRITDAAAARLSEQGGPHIEIFADPRIQPPGPDSETTA